MFPPRICLSDPNDPLWEKWEELTEPRRLAYRLWRRERYSRNYSFPHDSPDFCHQGVIIGRAPPEIVGRIQGAVEDYLATPSVKGRIAAREGTGYKDFVTILPLTPQRLLGHPALELALSRPVLELIASYYGLFPRLVDISIHYTMLTDTPASASQLWHRDPGDLKLVKVFLYLNDVDEHGGPFCYIPGTQPCGPLSHVKPPHLDKELEGRERLWRITDEEMRAVIPEKRWVKCTGPIGTMVVADTIGYHRGLKPVKRERTMVCFTYNSGAGGRVLRLEPSEDSPEPQRWALQ